MLELNALALLALLLESLLLRRLLLLSRRLPLPPRRRERLAYFRVSLSRGQSLLLLCIPTQSLDLRLSGRQLCSPLAAWCRLAEQVYQFNSDAKSIVSVIPFTTI